MDKRIDRIVNKYPWNDSKELFRSELVELLATQRKQLIEEIKILIEEKLNYYIVNSASPLTMSSRGQNYIDGYNRMAVGEKQAFKHLRSDLIKMLEQNYGPTN